MLKVGFLRSILMPVVAAIALFLGPVWCPTAAADVEGVVVDEEWNPVSGTEVVLLYATWDGWGDLVFPKVKTGQDGRFSFTGHTMEQEGPAGFNGIPPRYGLLARHPEKGAALLQLPSYPIGFATVQLTPFETYSFRVVDEEGNAVVGANVFLRSAKEQKTADKSRVDQPFYFHKNLGLCSGVTDADGRITIAGPPRTVWAVEKDGYVPTISWQDETDLVLCRGVRVFGRVLDPAGQPVPHALVQYLLYTKSSRSWTRAVRADEQGKYEFACAAASGFRYNVAEIVFPGWSSQSNKSSLLAMDTSTNSAYLPKSVKVPVSPGETIEQDIQFEGRPLFTIRLIDANTGGPAVGVRLNYSHIGSVIWDMQFISDPEGVIRCPVLADSMEFRLGYSGSERGYFIDPAWSGFTNRGHVFTVEAVAGAEFEEKIPLLPTHAVNGRVLKIEGKPLAGAMVYAQYGWHSPAKSQGIEKSIADAEGRFTFKALPNDRPVNYIVFSADERWAGSAATPAGENSPEVVAKATRTLHGRVVDREGNPANTAKFDWTPILEYDSMPHSNVYARGQTVMTNELGCFSIEHVSPDLHYIASVNYYIGEEVPPLGDKDDITLSLRTFNRTLTGHVVDESGTPLEYGTVYSPCTYMDPGWSRKEAKIDAHGNFVFPDMPTGPTYLSVCGTLVSVPADQDNITVVLRKAYEFRYRLLDEEKNPLPNATVIMRAHGDEWGRPEISSHSFTMDSNGEFLLPIRRVGKVPHFTAEFRAEGYPLAFVTIRSNAKEGEDTDFWWKACIDVVLRKQEPWRGRVVDTHGAGIADAEVRVTGCEYRSGTGDFCPFLGEDREDLATRTDSQGYWTIPSLSQDDKIYFRVRAKGYDETRDVFSPNLITARETILLPARG